jgi:hypothetical protein
MIRHWSGPSYGRFRKSACTNILGFGGKEVAMCQQGSADFAHYCNCVCRKEKALLSHRLDSHKPDSHKPDSHMPDSHMPDSHMPDSHRPEEDGPVTLCKIQCNYYAGYALVAAPRPGILDRLN